MREMLLAAALVLWGNLYPQGLLRSRILHMTDTSVVCTLTVRNIDNWDDKREHYFKVSTSTYLLPGDYLIHYYVDTTWLHGEWIHVSRKFVIINKVVLYKRIPLSEVRFIKPKDDTGSYLEY